MSTERQFETSLDLSAPTTAVWRALTDAGELSRWFAPKSSFDPRVGGAVVWEWNELCHWPLTVETLEEGRHLRTCYASAVDDGAGGKRPLFVDFFLSGEGGTTTLRLVHSGFDEDARFDEEFDGVSRGWVVELQSLKLYLERFAGRDRQLAWSEKSLDLTPEETWRRLTGARGLACGEALDRVPDGEPFSFATADGDRFEGTALCPGPREFVGVVHNRGNGFLRAWTAHHGGSTQVWLWLATYDRPAAEVAALQEHWDALLDRLFAGHEVTAVPERGPAS